MAESVMVQGVPLCQQQAGLMLGQGCQRERGPLMLLRFAVTNRIDYCFLPFIATSVVCIPSCLKAFVMLVDGFSSHLLLYASTV